MLDPFGFGGPHQNVDLVGCTHFCVDTSNFVHLNASVFTDGTND